VRPLILKELQEKTLEDRQVAFPHFEEEKLAGAQLGRLDLENGRCTVRGGSLADEFFILHVPRLSCKYPPLLVRESNPSPGKGDGKLGTSVANMAWMAFGAMSPSAWYHNRKYLDYKRYKTYYHCIDALNSLE